MYNKDQTMDSIDDGMTFVSLTFNFDTMLLSDKDSWCKCICFYFNETMSVNVDKCNADGKTNRNGCYFQCFEFCFCHVIIH